MVSTPPVHAERSSRNSGVEAQPILRFRPCEPALGNERLGEPVSGIAIHPDAGVIRFESFGKFGSNGRANQCLAHTASTSPSSACAVISGPAPGPWITSGWVL